MSDKNKNIQKIIIYQEHGNGSRKSSGVLQYASDKIEIESISIDEALSPILDETDEYLLSDLDCDLVLSFLTHPDLNYDLAVKCRDREIPFVASGKKIEIKSAITPPT